MCNKHIWTRGLHFSVLLLQHSDLLLLKISYISSHFLFYVLSHSCLQNPVVRFLRYANFSVPFQYDSVPLQCHSNSHTHDTAEKKKGAFPGCHIQMKNISKNIQACGSKQFFYHSRRITFCSLKHEMNLSNLSFIFG